MRGSRFVCSILPLGLAAWLALGLAPSPSPTAALAEDAQGAKPAAGEPVRVLVFSGAGWYRHPEIPRTNGWLERLGQEQGFVVDVTETPGDLTADRL
jgi:hypothetical protein